MMVTVAICTYNPDPGLLARVLEAIMAQRAVPEGMEVIVVDNNSSPPLARARFLDSYAIRLLEEPMPGLTAARERAIGAAAGDVIVFVDDDIILESHYVATVVQQFRDEPTLGLLGGRVLPEYEVSPPAWFAEFEPWLAIRRYSADVHHETSAPPYSDHFPVGAGLAVRAELAAAYVEAASSDGRIEGRRGTALSSGEDLDMGLYALAAGYKIAVDGRLGATHVIPRGRMAPKYLRRLAAANIKSSHQLEKKWSGPLGAPIYPMFAMPLWSVAVRALVTTLLAPWSPPHSIRRKVYLGLALVRVREVSRRPNRRVTRSPVWR
jgi:glycosyltransferase involved in cell wall biosynthesis